MNDEYEIHAAASVGSLERCVALLAADPPPSPNAPDAEGRSAIFYAQLLQHISVVELLERHGWARMPEGNVFTGPGGRTMWWTSGAWATERPRRSAAAEAQLFEKMVKTPVSASAKVAWRRSATVRERQSRRRELSWPTNVVGPAHKMYLRKRVGPSTGATGKRHPKPALNTRDYAEAYEHVDEPSLLDEQRAFLDACVALDAASGEVATAADEAEAMAEGVAPTPGSSRTMGEVARFVVDRKPTRAADGSWVVLSHAAEHTREVALRCAPAGGGVADVETQAALAESLAAARAAKSGLDAIPEDDAAAWPALPSRWVLLEEIDEIDGETAVSEVEAPSAIDDESASVIDSVYTASVLDSELASLVDPDELPTFSDEPMSLPPASRVWGGAASTRAAVGFASGEAAIFQPLAKPAASVSV